jgi:hypothetical protein
MRSRQKKWSACRFFGFQNDYLITDYELRLSESQETRSRVLRQGMTLFLGRLTFGKEEQDYVIR